MIFSRTGHTKPLAEYVAEELKADLYEIEAKIPYSDDDIKYYTNCRADREQNDPAARPEISSAENLHPLAPQARWEAGRRFEIGTVREEILEWIGSLDINPGKMPVSG